MNVQLIRVPYDSGQRDLRMGRGPTRFCEHGAADRLRAAGHVVTEATVEVSVPFPLEVGTTFALQRASSGDVCGAVARGALPLILAGNCSSALGTVSGVRAGAPNDSSDVGVIWLDAHADFNTPETTTSGFLDGTSLAALTGRCWHALTASIPGFRPVSDANVVLVGARDLDLAEEEALSRSRVTRVAASALETRGAAAALDDALTALAQRVSRVYLHIDLDVHEPSEAQANQYAVPGGLRPATVRDLVRVVADRFELAAVALTAYDPAYDPENRMLGVGLELIGAI
jgi:arginase